MKERAAEQITVPGHRFPIHLLDFYAQKGHRKVEGWLHPLAVQIICHLSNIQDELDIRGSVGEIGVHQCK